MFTYVPPESVDLHRSPFSEQTVQFNLLHRILKGREVFALRWADGEAVRAIAAFNPGFPMWLWVDPRLETAIQHLLLSELADVLRCHCVVGVAAAPGVASEFSRVYAESLGIDSALVMQMESYHCPEVVPPPMAVGQMVAALPEHLDLVANYCVGFAKWAFDSEVTKESQMASAGRLVSSGNLYLWEVAGRVVSMANVADRSAPYARVNSVYTPPEHRGNGFASSLVAQLGSRLLAEGLTPMLYTDLKNPTSNRIYRNIGYRECGKIDEYRFRY